MPDATTAEREAEQKLCAAMLRSRYWKWQLSYLAGRRDQLIAMNPRSSTEAAHTLGALHEIARLMSGPAIVAKYLATQDEPETDAQDTETEDIPWPRRGRDAVE